MNQEKILKEFIEKNPELLEGLSKSEVQKICYSPWQLLKSVIKSGTGESVRFKYLGSFKASKRNVKNRIKFLVKKVEEYPEDLEAKEDLEKLQTFLKNVEQNKNF